MYDNEGEFNIVNEMYNEADYYRHKADRLEKAAQMIEDDDGNFGNDNQGSNRGRNFSSNNRGRGYNADEVIRGQGGRGNRSFSNSDNPDDDRTLAGRMAHDADGYSDEDLNEFLNTARRNEDDSIDLRTEEGRALRAAGYIDDDGFPFEGQTSRGSSRGRNYSSNRGRGNSGNSGRGRSNTSNRGRSSGRSTSNR